MDLSRLSNEDLTAISAGDMTSVSTAGLQMLSAGDTVDTPVPDANQGKMDEMISRYRTGNLPARQMSLVEEYSGRQGWGLTYGMDRPESTFKSFAEPIATMASGVAGEVAGGLAGAVQSLNPWAEEGAGEEALETVREWMTYVPTDEGAKQTLGEVGELIQPSVEKYDKGKSAMADWTYEMTGGEDAGALSAGAAAAVYTAPEALLAILGIRRLRGMKTGTVLKDPSGNPTKQLRVGLGDIDYNSLDPAIQKLIPERVDANFFPIVTPNPKTEVFKTALVAQIQGGGTEGVLAKLKIDEYGRLGVDKIGKEAVKQGFDAPDVQAVKRFNGPTKTKAREMLRTMRQINKNTRMALDKRPSGVAGQAVVDRLDYIQAEMATANKELDRIADTELAGLEIDDSRILETLETELSDLNIGVAQAEDGSLSLVFEGSDLELSPGQQSKFEDVFELLQRNEGMDAKRAHRMKRQIDAMIDSSKQDATGLSGASKGFLQSMRKALNETVRDVNLGYKNVNERLSLGIQTIEDLDSAVGSTDLGAVSANEGLGTQLRKIMSNYASRPALIDSLDKLDATAKTMGLEFADNLKDLALFSNVLDRRFGNVAKTSLGGTMEQAATMAMRGDKVGMIGKVFGKAAEKMSNVSDLNAFEAMEALLKEGEQP